MYLLPTWLVGLRLSLYRPHTQAQTPLQRTAGGGLMGAAWRAAAVFAVGNAVCGLVVSGVTDLAGRVAFVRELRRRGAAGQQLSQRGKCGGGVTGSSSRTTGSKAGKLTEVVY